MRKILENQENLTIRQVEVTDILTQYDLEKLKIESDGCRKNHISNDLNDSVDLDDSNDINNYCPKCNIFICNGTKIKHCYICDNCIEEFDHHCFWIGKCIGKNNKKIFLLLLVLMEFNFIINTIICIAVEPLFESVIVLPELSFELPDSFIFPSLLLLDSLDPLLLLLSDSFN